MALRRDLGEHQLKKGDVAMLVDYVPHPAGGEDGYVLEVFNAVGDPLSAIVVGESDVGSLQPDEVLAVRPLRRVG